MLLVRHRLGGGDDAHRGRRDDGLQVRVAAQQAVRLAVALVGLVVAVDDGRPASALAYSGLASAFFITAIQMFWLVAWAEADRIAISPSPPIALWRHLRPACAPISGVRRGFRCISRPSWRHAAVERHHLDAALHRLLHRSAPARSGSLAEMTMAFDLLRDQRVDDLDLALGGGRGRAGVDDLDVAQLLGRFLGALVGGVEEAVAEAFHDHRDLGLFAAAAGGGAVSFFSPQPAVAAGADGGQHRRAEFSWFQCEASGWTA